MYTWQIIMPIKGGPEAKSRLAASIGSAPSSPSSASGAMADAYAAVTGDGDLARAIAADSVAAALSAQFVSHVVAVLGAADDEGWVRDAGARTVLQPGRGLIDAIGAGVRAADPEQPCAILLADVPALNPAELDDALAQIAQALGMGSPSSDTDAPCDDDFDEDLPRQAFVPDHTDMGTVLLAARRPADLTPAFGPDSAWLHAQTGAQRLPGP